MRLAKAFAGLLERAARRAAQVVAFSVGVATLLILLDVLLLEDAPPRHERSEPG